MKVLLLALVITGCVGISIQPASPSGAPAKTAAQPSIQEPAIVAPIAFNCPLTKLFGFPKDPTPLDAQTLETASRRCSILYKNSPCLKVLFKVTELSYRAICGDNKPLKDPEFI